MMNRLFFLTVLCFACSPAQPEQVASPDVPAPAAAPPPDGGTQGASSTAPAESAANASAAGPSVSALEDSKKCGKCKPSLTCVEVGKVARCVQLLDLQHVAGKDDLDGRMVGIRGGELKAGTSCTKMMCPPDRPCCNSCTATMFFAANEVSITPTRAGSEIKCPKSNNCDVVKSCPLKEGRYDAIGKVVAQPIDRYYKLEVSALEPAAR
jgi:hypothetical protein